MNVCSLCIEGNINESYGPGIYVPPSKSMRLVQISSCSSQFPPYIMGK